jgi:predicted HAD superfamily phosphohydrolase
MPFRAVAYQKKLQEVGVDAKVAQAHAEALEEFVVGEVVTKDHLDTKLAELVTKLAEMKLEMIRWIVGTVGAASIGIIVTILVALLRIAR